jgi:ubiquinone/menaquinone biosynthesis C-methylase UbiE
MIQHASDHNRIIIEQFSRQAITFAKLPGHSQSIQMLIELSGISATDDVLDVACGPGLVACEFAQHARHVTGIDITPQRRKN